MKSHLVIQKVSSRRVLMYSVNMPNQKHKSLNEWWRWWWCYAML